MHSIISLTNAAAVFAKAVDGIICYDVIRGQNGRPEDFIFVSLNDSALKILGAAREKYVGQRFLPLFPGSLESGLFQAFVDAADTGEIKEVEFSYKDHNYEGWYKDTVIPFEDRLIVFFSNITEKKEMQIRLAEKTAQLEKAKEELSASLHEKETLLREVHHRVKNNLQIISSIINLQMSYSEGSATVDLLRETQLRVKAIALLHQKLYENPNLSTIDFPVYLSDIIGSVYSTFKSENSKISLMIDIDEQISISVDNGIYLGLIVTELVTNTFKHGFIEGTPGKLMVTIKKSDMIELVVEDTGRGLPENFNIENTDTLGMQLIVSLTSQLKGTISAGNYEGARFTILFPAS